MDKDTKRQVAIASARAALKVMGDVLAERTFQDEQWGGPEHDDGHTLADWRDYIVKQADRSVSSCDARACLVKVAALALAAIESLDRKAGARPSGE